MSAAAAVAVAATFVWIGLIVGISGIEAPLKFRAPDVTLRIGLGIGRIVFRAINTTEAVLALVIVVAGLVAKPGWPATIALAAALVALLVQLAVIRPRLNRRTDAVLAGHEGPRSHAHVGYVALEAVKLVALVLGGIALFLAA